MQTDLFENRALPGSAKITAPKTDFLQRYRLYLRLDQALVGLICLVVVYVIVFSFGVEKGKHFAMAELKAERAKRERMVKEFAAAPRPDEPADTIQPAVQDLLKEGSAPLGAEDSAAKSPAKVEAAQPSEIPAGKYTIQIITFISQGAAERKIKSLTEQGQKSFIIPSGKFLQVCVNAFDSKAKADRALTQLKEQGLVPQDAYVRNIP